jgi:signal transduction histidine kinase
VHTDKEQMLRVFNNLMKNAEQAMPDDRSGSILLRLSADAQNIRIEIEDNGKGIPESIRERIFHPKFTTKSTGMGLGLALVKNIIESSDGTIQFESEVGKGTKFIIELPVYKPI